MCAKWMIGQSGIGLEVACPSLLTILAKTSILVKISIIVKICILAKIGILTKIGILAKIGIFVKFFILAKIGILIKIGDWSLNRYLLFILSQANLQDYATLAYHSFCTLV